MFSIVKDEDLCGSVLLTIPEVHNSSFLLSGFFLLNATWILLISHCNWLRSDQGYKLMIARRFLDLCAQEIEESPSKLQLFTQLKQL